MTQGKNQDIEKKLRDNRYTRETGDFNGMWREYIKSTKEVGMSESKGGGLKIAIIAASFLIIAGISWFAVTKVASANLNAKIESGSALVVSAVIGDVKVKRQGNEEWKPVLINDNLQMGDAIKTGEESYVELQMIKRGIFRVDSDSELLLAKLTSVNGKVESRMKLEKGTVALKPNELEEEEEFEVETDTAVAAVRGTKFSVSIDDSGNTAVSVVEGKVAMRPRVKSIKKARDKGLVDADAVKDLEIQVVAEIEIVTGEEASMKKERVEALDKAIEKAVEEVAQKEGKITKASIEAPKAVVGEAEKKPTKLVAAINVKTTENVIETLPEAEKAEAKKALAVVKKSGKVASATMVVAKKKEMTVEQKKELEEKVDETKIMNEYNAEKVKERGEEIKKEVEVAKAETESKEEVSTEEELKEMAAKKAEEAAAKLAEEKKAEEAKKSEIAKANTSKGTTGFDRERVRRIRPRLTKAQREARAERRRIAKEEREARRAEKAEIARKEREEKLRLAEEKRKSQPGYNVWKKDLAVSDGKLSDSVLLEGKIFATKMENLVIMSTEGKVLKTLPILEKNQKLTRPVVGNGMVYVGAVVKGELYAFDKEGTKVWEAKTGGQYKDSAPAADHGLVAVSTLDEGIRVFTSTGVEKKHIEISKQVFVPPVILKKGETIVYGTETGDIVAYDLVNEKTLWTKNYVKRVALPIVGDDDTLVAIEWKEGKLFGIDSQTGEQKWTKAIDGLAKTKAIPVFSDGRMVLVTRDMDKVYVVSTAGEVVFEKKFDEVQGTPKIQGDWVFIGADNKMFAQNVKTGSKWSYDAKEKVSIIVADDKHVYGISDTSMHKLVK